MLRWSSLCALVLACADDSHVALDSDDVALDSDDVALDSDDVAADSDGVTEPTRLWQRFEATLDDPPVTADNPFDPREVALDVTFEAPDGATWTVPAYVDQAFTRTLEGDAERLTADGARRWKVRFRPPAGSAAGTWRWRVTGGDGEWHDFVPTPATGHGVVRVSPRDRRWLAYEDGAPFVAIGENLAWAGRGGTFDYDAWMERLAASGATWVRVWMPSWGMGLEWETLGDYGARLDRAWQLDHVLAKAEALGLTVMLSLQNHGPFSRLHASQWHDNPYNAANGGPLATPTAFFSDPEARRLFRQRLRYIAARWAAYDSVMAWELWNEVDLVSEPTGADVGAWTSEMAAELRRLDPARHLVTTSVSGIELLGAVMTGDTAALAERYPFWSMPEIDLVQVHLYGFAGVQLDFMRDLARLDDYWRAFDKPALLAECGVSAVSAEDTLALDPSGAGFHDILWGGLFAGAAGTGMSWWWDGLVAPQGYEADMAPLAELVQGVAFDREGARAIDLEGAGAVPLEGRALRGSSVVLAWVKRASDQWFAEDLAPVEGGVVVVPGVGAGRWRARWIDPRPGDTEAPPVETQELAVGSDARLELELPRFVRDLGVRVERVGD